MAKLTGRPTVFIASSTQALGIARTVRRGLEPVADVVLWDTAFDEGSWLLQSILDQAQRSDFGVFIVRADDTAVIKGTQYYTVRENVLFELGVFMGVLGPERSLLLWPNLRMDKELRLPPDLAGLLRVQYNPPRSDRSRAGLATAVAAIRRRVVTLGRALRSGYNEIAALKQALFEREIEFEDDSTADLLSLVAEGARSRGRPWFGVTEVSVLTRALERRYDPSVVDLVFWWLVLYGIIAFDNVETWNVDGDWEYSGSVELSAFTLRGVVLLNELRAGSSAGRRPSKRAKR